MSRFRFIPRIRGRAALTAAGVLGAACLMAAGVAVASESNRAVPAPPTFPTRADQIQNIDQVRTAIKAYYGDTPDTTTVDPVTNAKDLHTFNPSGAYAREVSGVAKTATRYLGAQARAVSGDKHPPKLAVVFDVDDTTLNTYNYEIYSNFVYSPTSNAAFVNAGVFPAVPGMVSLEKYAEAKGYTVFFLTGRPGTQKAATVSNLTSVGYDVNQSNVYLKDYTADTWLSPCATTCTTIQYKSLTREHIQSLGYKITANLGDQYSDLKGGYAKQTFKVPNPMYYLP